MLTLFTGKAVRDREALAHDIAKIVARESIARMSEAACDMNAAELRGYIRSRAAKVAKTTVCKTIADLRIGDEVEAELTSAVLELTVHLVARELSARPVVALPMPHVQSRAA